MSDDNDLNEHGNHEGEFHQTVGGWAEYTVNLTEIKDTVRHDVTVPPKKIIPIIFLPGVMGSNLRMSKTRQKDLDKTDNISWRPDDMMDLAGKWSVVEGYGIGGWYKNASPRDRQLALDPNETEVEYYIYSTNQGRFDPSGSLTGLFDLRHTNIPNDFAGVPPLIAVSDKKRKENATYKMPGVLDTALPLTLRETPAQIARWRGWSEILFIGAYGEMLKTAEFFMNNIVRKNNVLPHWQTRNTDSKKNQGPYPEISKLLIQAPTAFGATSGAVISEADLKKISSCWYPVHAMGYNFLQSNAVSAGVIAERLRGLVKGYVECGFKCDEIILVTHSMGGLLARALMHPSYGNLVNDEKVKVLGIYHNVMPSIGAASAYKRMRFGFQEKSGLSNKKTAQVLGIDGEHATAMVANAPAALEMMPGIAYGPHWLKVVDKKDQILWSWPQEGKNALDSIYLKPENNWWRLINPLWVNPANLGEKQGGGMKNVNNRIRKAFEFSQSLENFFHKPTYASYCESREHLSFGEVTFKVIDGMGGGLTDFFKKFTPPPVEKWTLLSDDAKGILTVKAGSRVLKLKLQPAKDPGDETVPAMQSARHITGNIFRHGVEAGTGYEHQDSYLDKNVLASMLYSIVQIAKLAEWKKK